MDMGQTMDSIINHDAGVWQLEAISNVILGEDRCEIKKIYFGNPDLPDRLIWLADKKGNYSVKSGYRWVYDRGGKWRAQRPSSFCPTNPSGNWRVVATTLSLFRRKCSTSPLCPICDEHDESFKINVDARWKLGVGRGFVGMVVQDNRRECHEVTRMGIIASNTLMVEDLAVCKGCVLAQPRNLTHIIVEFNFKHVILFLNYTLDIIEILLGLHLVLGPKINKCSSGLCGITLLFGDARFKLGRLTPILAHGNLEQERLSLPPVVHKSSARIGLTR
ncbi:hypothetical protein ACFX11_025039 [Malus domestica]